MTDTKAIFITGGAWGIGLAMARLFAAKGWRVGLADVDEAGLTRAVAVLPAGQAWSRRLDVRDREGWAAALDDFTEWSGGRLDVLANNAGIGLGGPMASVAWDDLDRVVEINLKGVLNGARIGHEYLKRTPGSCLLNTASASAIYGSAGLAPYSACKFAVRGLTEALDGEWAADGIKVRAIVPGFIDTPLLDGGAGLGNRKIRDVVTGAGLELTSPEKVAEAAWAAVHGDRVHTYVGPTARRMAFAARWMPGQLRRLMRRRLAE